MTSIHRLKGLLHQVLLAAYPSFVGDHTSQLQVCEDAVAQDYAIISVQLASNHYTRSLQSIRMTLADKIANIGNLSKQKKRLFTFALMQKKGCELHCQALNCTA